ITVVHKRDRSRYECSPRAALAQDSVVRLDAADELKEQRDQKYDREESHPHVRCQSAENPWQSPRLDYRDLAAPWLTSRQRHERHRRHVVSSRIRRRCATLIERTIKKKMTAIAEPCAIRCLPKPTSTSISINVWVLSNGPPLVITYT